MKPSWMRIMAVILLVLGIAACAPSKTTVADRDVPRPPASDTELFEEGLTALEAGGGTEGLAKARNRFAELTVTYPESRWVRTAEALVRLLDEQERLIESIQTGARTATEAAEAARRIQRENEQLRREMGQTRERLQAELAALQQENEQLRKDLKLLKELEIQLHQRNRTAR